VYLPAPSDWFAFNLRAFEDNTSLGVALEHRVPGGKHVHYTASINAVWNRDQDRLNTDNLPYVTPMYVREGKLICKV
jgi:hypothetical protein